MQSEIQSGPYKIAILSNGDKIWLQSSKFCFDEIRSKIIVTWLWHNLRLQLYLVFIGINCKHIWSSLDFWKLLYFNSFLWPVLKSYLVPIVILIAVILGRFMKIIAIICVTYSSTSSFWRRESRNFLFSFSNCCFSDSNCIFWDANLSTKAWWDSESQ